TNSSSSFGPSNQNATQSSSAIYFRDEFTLNKLRIAAGVRHEEFEQEVKTVYDQSISLNAWDVQASYDISADLSLFGKVGRSYRIANVDDNAFLFAPLNPQRSHDLELGSTFGNDSRKLTVKVFRHRLKDEILYDAFAFMNVNLDPTQRQGLEIEGRARLSSGFVLSGVLQHMSAKFIDGPYDGNEMVLVPKNIATLRLNWEPGNGQTADIGVQWVDSQRNGNDFSNSCSSRIPSFTTIDARYALRLGTWEFAVVGSNLTGKDYYTYAFGRDCGNNRGIYPEPGRSIHLSARKDF
ncbi:MAG TPA: TonB-dependent receptor, partial [Oxalicibacterium sp.]|nr:TonB-dependent receptor [Oxalicibacterium sp.]